MQYVAKFYKEDDGIGVEFPDVPGAYTCADSLEAAMEMAKEALNGVLRSMLERHDPLPVAKTRPSVEENLIPIDVETELAI
jgi:antitoxin HicB